jgi:hypothetical protein
MRLRSCQKKAIKDGRLPFHHLFLAVVQASPVANHFLINVQNLALGIESKRKLFIPRLQSLSFFCSAQFVYSSLYLTENQGACANISTVHRQPMHNSGIRSLLRWLAQNIAIHQIHHSFRSRAIPGVRPISLWRFFSGQASRWATKSKGFCSGGLAFLNSSCDTTKTTGFPCRVMVWAPSVSARFTTSLKEFFASCSCQLADFFPAFISLKLPNLFCPV